ncbi:MAG: ATP-binding protein [Burkholderiales bacterium]|nr:ATP-binding protein [Burkholderiales bacterium]
MVGRFFDVFERGWAVTKGRADDSSQVVPDFKEGIKNDVAEIKFLIHDLRVEGFFNEILHYHVTLNTDLEIYNIEQAQVLHWADVQELKSKLSALRRVFQDYSNAVKSFSPDRTVLLLGRRYVDIIHEACHLILSPLWGRSDQVLTFLPEDARSVRSRRHYRNCISWLYGVHLRIAAFRAESIDPGLKEEFDVADDIRDFTQDVVRGYVVEKSDARVELQLGRLDSAVVVGRRPRFRRMYFNLVRNAVDAMKGRRAGVVRVSVVVEGDRAALHVSDDGVGMPAEKIQQLLADRQTLDGEVHSLGFVFVRQTLAEFGGEMAVESTIGKGTTITLRLPYLKDKILVHDPAYQSKYRLPEKYRTLPVEPDAAQKSSAGATTAAAPDAAPVPKQEAAAGASTAGERAFGRLLFEAYRKSRAQFPGCIFAMAVTEGNRVEMFTHKPYERDFNISHEDLSPTYYQATYRGRIEEDELKAPVVILKPPQTIGEYFDFKDVDEADRAPDRFAQMVRDEGIRIARKLIATGLDAKIGVTLGSASQFFPASPEFHGTEPFPLELLARQKLSAGEG